MHLTVGLWSAGTTIVGIYSGNVAQVLLGIALGTSNAAAVYVPRLSDIADFVLRPIRNRIPSDRQPAQEVNQTASDIDREVVPRPFADRAPGIVLTNPAAVERHILLALSRGPLPAQRLLRWTRLRFAPGVTQAERTDIVMDAVTKLLAKSLVSEATILPNTGDTDPMHLRELAITEAGEAELRAPTKSAEPGPEFGLSFLP